MGANFIQILCSILLMWTYRSAAVRVGCPTNKVAPKLFAEGRTFGLLFGNRYQLQQNDASSDDCSNRPVASVGDPETDYDPVSSGEDIEYQDNTNTVIRPPRPQGPFELGGLLDWWPGSNNNRPTPPPRPFQSSPNWFWGWFDGFQNPTPRPTKPPYYEDATKPVHEYIENDEINVTWRPGTIVGGPNNDIIAVTQDLSNWSTVPPPRPTRPYIPGQRVTSSRYENQGIIGSFIDLFTKK